MSEQLDTDMDNYSGGVAESHVLQIEGNFESPESRGIKERLLYKKGSPYCEGVKAISFSFKNHTKRIVVKTLDCELSIEKYLSKHSIYHLTLPLYKKGIHCAISRENEIYSVGAKVMGN